MHRIRSSRGSILVLATALVAFLLAIGAGFLYMTRFMGANKEAANATEAGTLAVARHALNNVTVPLERNSVHGDQVAAYDDVTDPPGCKKVSLLSYNRLAAKALIVALNAEEIEGRQGGRAWDKYLELRRMLQQRDGIAQRLTDELGSKVKGIFDPVAGAEGNAPRLLDEAVSRRIGYVGEGEPSNIFMDDDICSLYSSQRLTLTESIPTNIGPRQFLQGYKDQVARLFFVPVFNGKRPQLISTRYLDRYRLRPKDDSYNPDPNGWGPNNVPPNSFTCTTQTTETSTGKNMERVASAIVGNFYTSGDTEVNHCNAWQPRIPHGYIMIDNRGAYLKMFSRTSTAEDHIRETSENGQFYSGIRNGRTLMNLLSRCLPNPAIATPADDRLADFRQCSGNLEVMLASVRKRMLQIKPNAAREATPSSGTVPKELYEVLNNYRVPFDKVSYIYLQPDGGTNPDGSYIDAPASGTYSTPNSDGSYSNKGHLVISTTPPPWIDPNASTEYDTQPPGTPGVSNPNPRHTYSWTGWHPIQGAAGGEGGNSWDWYPSSGANNLLGVLKFTNSAKR